MQAMLRQAFITLDLMTNFGATWRRAGEQMASLPKVYATYWDENAVYSVELQLSALGGWW